MATAPFGAALEAALKLDVQGGSLSVCKGPVKLPRFFCCIAGTTVGALKDPVAVLILDKTRACTNEAVTADMSHCWHPMTPAFSIQTYFIDWGDGQTSGPAACPAGVCPVAVAHPLGGYVAAGIYTITLTVTDNQAPAATAEDTVQIEVVDCVGPLGLGAFGACGASGVWFTEDGGLNWSDRSGELAGVVVYDLEVNPFSLGGVRLLYDAAGNPYVQGDENIELWAATAAGLWKSMNGGGAWNEVDLGLAAGSAVAAVLCSKYDPLEVYALVHNAGGSDVWLYRSVDGGVVWTNIQLAIPTGGITQEWPAGGATFNMVTPPWIGVKFAEQDGELYFSGDDAPASKSIWHRNTPLDWNNIGDLVNWAVAHGVTGDGHLWAGVGTGLAERDGLSRWNGISWDLYGANAASMGWIGGWVLTLANGHVAVSHALPITPWPWDTAIETISEYDQEGNLVNRIYWGETSTWPASFPAWSTLGPIGQDNLGLYAVGRYNEGALDREWQILKYNGSWSILWSGDYFTGPEPIHFVSANGGMYTVLYEENQLLRYGLVDSVVCPDPIRWAHSVGNNLYVGAGTKIYRHGVTQYTEICDFGKDVQQFTYYDGRFYAAITQVPARGIRISSCQIDDTLTLPTDGRHHIMDMDGGGNYIYVAALDAAGNPVIMRVPYDLSIVDLLYQPGAGAWGGVEADPNMTSRIWIFGDFGAALKVQSSDDYGDTWDDKTDAAWAGTDIVRPVLPSLYDPADIFAVENIAAGIAQAWHSGDAGATWNGPNALDAAGIVVSCGERDFVEPASVFVGRVAAGANNLRFSPNNGGSWTNRNGGFPANAPVTSIIVVA